MACVFYAFTEDVFGCLTVYLKTVLTTVLINSATCRLWQYVLHFHSPILYYSDMYWKEYMGLAFKHLLLTAVYVSKFIPCAKCA